MAARYVILILAGALLFTTLPAQAAWRVISPPEQALFIELFTSQGCSSCPPADAWLSNLRSREDLFTRVVPIAYHVTYWNYLGWPDPFGLDDHNERHRARAKSARAGVYTPGVFAGGQEWRSWRRHGQLSPLPSQPAVGVLSVNGLHNQIEVEFTPHDSVRQEGALRALASYLRMRQVTSVSSGENAGRQLRHDFVAGEVVATRLRMTAGKWYGQLPLAQPEWAQAVAVWVASPTGRVVQATGRRLAR